jgi:hypothetical protein
MKPSRKLPKPNSASCLKVATRQNYCRSTMFREGFELAEQAIVRERI